MRYDLKTPCKNCPFRTDATAIRFSGRARAEEIEEQAYRNGFPCHKSAEYYEDPSPDSDGEFDGYYPGENTQHCVGAIIMYLKEQEYGWPGIDNDEDLALKLEAQVDMDAPVWEGAQAFLDSYGPEDDE